jgi:hypothetical protein
VDEQFSFLLTNGAKLKGPMRLMENWEVLFPCAETRMSTLTREES